MARLGPTRTVVLLAIEARLPNPFPSYETIEADVGIGRSQVAAYVADLREAGLIRSRRRVDAGGRNRSNLYEVADLTDARVVGRVLVVLDRWEQDGGSTAQKKAEERRQRHRARASGQAPESVAPSPSRRTSPSPSRRTVSPQAEKDLKQQRATPAAAPPSAPEPSPEKAGRRRKAGATSKTTAPSSGSPESPTPEQQPVWQALLRAGVTWPNVLSKLVKVEGLTPARVQFVADRAAATAPDNPAGLIVTMIRAGDHVPRPTTPKDVVDMATEGLISEIDGRSVDGEELKHNSKGVFMAGELILPVDAVTGANYR